MEQQLNNNHSFNLKQREMFARLLEKAKARVETELEQDYQLNNRVEEELLPKLAKEHGASDLIAKVRRLHKEHEEAENALAELGFHCSDDSISLNHEAPKALKQAVKKAQDAARTERDVVLTKFDRAILEVWAATEAAKAKKIVEGLL